MSDDQTPQERADTHSPDVGTTDAADFARRAYALVSELRDDPNPVGAPARSHSLEERVHILERQVDVLAAALAKYASVD